MSSSPRSSPGVTRRSLHIHCILGSWRLVSVLFSKHCPMRSTRQVIIILSLTNRFASPDIWFKDDRSWYFQYIMRAMTSMLGRNSVQGAMTTVHCAVSDEAGTCSGKYWDSCRIRKSNPLGHDKDIARKLWEVSRELSGLSKEEYENVWGKTL